MYFGRCILLSSAGVFWFESLNTYLVKVFCLFPRLARHRQIAEPELVAESSEDSDEGTWHPEREESSEEEEEEEEVDDEVSMGNRWLKSHLKVCD